MRYSGSKAKIAKHIIPFIMEELKNGYTYVEPFVGGCNMIDKVDWPSKVGYDNNQYVIGLWNAVKMGIATENSVPRHISDVNYQFHLCDEKCISEYDYLAMKRLSEGHARLEKDYQYPNWLIGYVGNCCSYGSAWFNGLAKCNHNRNEDHVFEAYNGFIKQIRGFKHLYTTYFVHADYKTAFELETTRKNKNVVFYCDPPYKGTKGYYGGKFNSLKFWDIVRAYAKNGFKIFVSEYEAPDDFKCIWSMDRKDGMGTVLTGGKQKTKTEKLFIYEQ